MSKYTTEVRFICETVAGYDESQGYAEVDTIIDKAIPQIFSFPFPIFDENYREILEKKILKHFYTREIAHETYGLWKLKLDTKLNEIMPYYNKLYDSELLEFNPLYTKDYTRTTKNAGQTTSETTSNAVTNGTSNETHSDVTNNANANTNTDLYSDTPQGQLAHVEDETYLTNARQVTDNTVNHGESSGNSGSNSNSASASVGSARGTTFDDYIERVVGYDGKCAAELLMQFRKTFLNIDMMIINDLEELFFTLW